MASVSEDVAPTKTPTMIIRAHIREIEEELGQLLRETDCATQIAMLFNVGRKFDALKAFLREKEAECKAGRIAREEYESFVTEFQRVREWVSNSISPLFDLFFQQYHFQVANSRKLMEQVYAVRHEVYCRELGFEPLKTDRQEVDEYDHLSRHVLLTRADEPSRGIGCIRVVFLSPTSVAGIPTDQLPFTKICKSFYSHDPSQMNREAICEISRLSILSEYRTTRTTDPIKRLVTLALPLSAYVVGLQYSADYAYQLCEPPLAQYLSKSLGAPLVPIGEPIDFHGTRIPTVVHGRSSVESFDLIPYTFYRLLQRHLYGTPVSSKPCQAPLRAKL